MGPARKSRNMNKRYSYINDFSPSKDEESAKRSNSKKRKLSDMLGPQWSKEELGRFYDAYRKHGKDWKKVAAAVRNRSVEMVEALYTMNRAYLSLPEGTASVVGLIAMMTDYYSNLVGSDSEQESNDGTGTSRKPQKRARGKVQPNTSKESDGLLLDSQTIAPGYGSLTLLKKKRSGGSRPRAVGKRTPRFPVSFSYDNRFGEKYFSPTRQGLKMKANANDDDVAHEIALALTEASHRGGSPQVSQTPNKRTESVTSSPVRSAGRKKAELRLGNTKLGGSDLDDDDEVDGSMEADTGELFKYKAFTETGRDGTVPKKGRRPGTKKQDIDEASDSHLDDIKEACSGTEGQRLVAGRGKLKADGTDAKSTRSSLQGPRKRSKKVLFTRDEVSAFDALQTLADLSLMMPGTADEDESTVQVKDEADDHVDESEPLEAVRSNNEKEKDRHKPSGSKVKRHQPISRVDIGSSKSRPGKVSVGDTSGVPELSQDAYQSKATRRKQKVSPMKNQRTEDQLNMEHSENLETEARDAGKKSTMKGKRSQSASPKLVKNPEHSSSTDPRKEGSDSAQSAVQVPAENQLSLPTKVRSRRKMHLKKPQMQKDLKYSDGTTNDQAHMPLTSFNGRSFAGKEKLSNCLLNHRMRRWCTYEWFYSAIDYPWFAKREFVEYLYHVGLGHVPRLTRVEWGVIRSSLGKPRRFSEQFLKEEKEKLNQYRDSVRKHYTELREGIKEGLPTDLARPLSVGQRVIAIHPKTREIHDGSVLTVDHSRCRIQFDRPELGVEFVMDVDCMPLNPHENMPTLLARQSVSVDKFIENLNEIKMNGQAKEYLRFFPGDNGEIVDVLSHLSPSTHPVSNLLKQNKGIPTNDNVHGRIGPADAATYQQIAYSEPCTLTQVQAKEADVQALAELTRALDKKEAVVSELRRMNDDVSGSQKDGDCSLKDSDLFKKQYAAVLIQLNEANEQVSSALYCLRQRNTYQGNIPVPWPRSVTISGDPGGVSFLDHPATQSQEPGSHVNGIIESSRAKARTMVDAAMLAMASLKYRDNTFEKIEEAIDYVNDRLPFDDSSTEAVYDLKLKTELDRDEACIPSELITQCVATLLMIQKCTERQFPPAEVAQILGSAVTSLQPCCTENLSVYAEIQKCMGIIKNQILALIPT